MATSILRRARRILSLPHIVASDTVQHAFYALSLVAVTYNSAVSFFFRGLVPERIGRKDIVDIVFSRYPVEIIRINDGQRSFERNGTKGIIAEFLWFKRPGKTGFPIGGFLTLRIGT